MSRPAVTRVSGVHGVVGIVWNPTGDERQLSLSARRLESFYRGFLGPACRARSLWIDRARVGVVVLDGCTEPLGPRLAWGVPVSDHGLASDGEVAGALAQPTSARSLLGTFVLAEAGPAHVRLITSSDMINTLKRVDGGRAVAWATRGLAAHVLAGVRPRVEVSHAVEHVLYDYVTGDDELLADTVVIGEAQVIDVDERGHTSSSWWALEERVEPGRPSDAAGLRRTVGDVVEKVGQVPGVRLGLTAGRDSSLLLSCLWERGGRLPLFTMGWDGVPDVQGAQALAKRVGWPHSVAEPALLDGRPLQSGVTRRGFDPGLLDGPAAWRSVVGMSAWSEGLDTPRNILAGWLSWDAERVLWLSGSGGETGRAFYWSDVPDPVDPLAVLIERPGRGLSASALGLLRERVGAEVDLARAVGRRGPDAADFFYVHARMRKWLARSLPLRQLDNVIGGYLSPLVVRTLLNVPLDERRGGVLFDRALALGAMGDTARVAGRAAEASPVRRLARRAGRRFAWGRPAVPSDWHLLLPLLRHLDGGPSPLRELLGERWWSSTVEAGPGSPDARRMLWNAVAVEALAEWAETSPWPPGLSVGIEDRAPVSGEGVDRPCAE